MCALWTRLSLFLAIFRHLALVGLRVKMSKCKLWSSLRVLLDKDFSKLHFGHRWLTHFGCANGFLKLCHTFFGWGFSSRCGAYRWSSSLGRSLGCIGHFVFMCHSLTFLFHSDNTFSFFILISFGEFRQENYASLWGHYGSRVMGVYSGPFSETLSPTTDLL